MPRAAAVATRAAATVGVLAVLGASLSACGGDGGGGSGDSPGAGSPVRTSSSGGPTAAPKGSKSDRTPTSAPPATTSGTGTATGPAGAVSLGQSLTVGDLQVRALRYQKAGFGGAATGTRVDVVTVEECAGSGSAVVQHRNWRLLDAAGRTLGRAGGKMVNGNPTEDLPTTLTAGQCLTTSLAIGVPAGSTPAAVQDGPADTWLLTD